MNRTPLTLWRNSTINRADSMSAAYSACAFFNTNSSISSRSTPIFAHSRMCPPTSRLTADDFLGPPRELDQTAQFIRSHQFPSIPELSLLDVSLNWQVEPNVLESMQLQQGSNVTGGIIEPDILACSTDTTRVAGWIA
jgi:hypothetical protein